MLVVWGKARILVDVTQARVWRWCGAETGDPPGSPAILPRHPHEASISLASLCVTNSSEKDAALLSLQLRTHSTPHPWSTQRNPLTGGAAGRPRGVCVGATQRGLKVALWNQQNEADLGVSRGNGWDGGPVRVATAPPGVLEPFTGTARPGGGPIQQAALSARGL